MTLRIAYTRARGGLSIVHAATKDELQKALGPLTQKEYVQFVVRRCVPADAVEVAVLPDSWAPPDGDRTFRDAWALAQGKIGLDMPQAREIWRKRMRQARAERLQDLDLAYMRADEADDHRAKSELASRKQHLRDVTSEPAIEAATTPDELRAIWPAILMKAAF